MPPRSRCSSSPWPESAAFAYLTPVSLAIALLLLIVIISYRQTIRAYPDGGGAFIVAHENLGLQPAMVAAAALLTDYTLTVSVSVAAGVAAITSAFPVISDWRVEIAVGLVILLTLANLRGVKESSTLFAIPTYAFVVTVFVMLVTGFVECIDGECPQAISAGTEVVPEVAAVSLFLILRAFASGSTALTGVEAIANGVPAFREPRAHNAAATLAVMGAISITMFLGISTLARLFDVRITEETVDEFGTVLSQIGRAAFNDGLGFWILQVVTAGILILAANTAYQDFPRLSAILARHKLMPRQFRNLGDRLVFSNGVIALAAIASLLIIVFDAEVTRLIQLYVIGVFISFTLSQAGMVRHWLRIRESGWRRSVVINAVGAVTTGVVLVVTASVKFSGGAWIVLVAIPLLVMLMASIRRHYLNVADQLRHVPTAPPFPGRNRAIVLVSRLGEATRRAVAYAELIGAETVSAVHIRESRDEELVETWSHLFPGLPLTLVEPDKGRTYRTLRSLIRAERQSHPEAFTTVIVPELIRSRSIWSVLASPHSLVVKLLLLFERGVVVTDLTQQRRPIDRTLVLAPTLERQEAVILISEVTQPARQAIGYSQLLCQHECAGGPPRHRRGAAQPGAAQVGFRSRQPRGGGEPVQGDSQADPALHTPPEAYRRPRDADQRRHTRVHRPRLALPVPPQPDGVRHQGDTALRAGGVRLERSVAPGRGERRSPGGRAQGGRDRRALTYLQRPSLVIAIAA